MRGCRFGTGPSKGSSAIWAAVLGQSRTGFVAAWTLVAAVACSGGDSEDPATEPQPQPQTEEPRALLPVSEGFVRHIISDDLDGPAFADVADLNGDGRLDIVSAQFGHREGMKAPFGHVTVHVQGATLDAWTSETVFSAEAEIVFPNHVEFHDLDADGDLDLLVPHGFLICSVFGIQCGGIAWFEQREEDWIRHTLIGPDSRWFYHRALFADLDGDGVDDLLTVGESFEAFTPDAETQWLKGTTSEELFVGPPQPIGPGMGGLPSLVDLDEDGDLDLIAAEFFYEASFVWYERVAGPSQASPAGVWSRHIIDEDVGPSIQLSLIDNLFGDGKRWLVGANHVNIHAEDIESVVYGYEVPADPTTGPWTRTPLSEGIESRVDVGFERNLAPGIFDYGDVDGDGDIDLVVSGDGDPDVYWLEQTEAGKLVTRVLQQDLPQAGSVLIRDLDGDGRNEILVSGYEHDVLMVLQRKADLLPTEP